MLAATLLAATPPLGSAVARGAERASESAAARADEGERDDREAERAAEPASFAATLAALLTPAAATARAPRTESPAASRSSTGPVAAPTTAPAPAAGALQPCEEPGSELQPAALHTAPAVPPPPIAPPPAAAVQALVSARAASPSLTGARAVPTAPLDTNAASGPEPAANADAAPPTGPVAPGPSDAGQGHAGQGDSPFDAQPPPPTAGPAAEDAAAEPPTFEPAAAATEVPDAPSADAPHVTRETAAALAAEMARKLDARVTRFELRLDPGGLGQVSVSLEIQAGGDISAHLDFERPETLADLRARSAELRDALQQAGFTLPESALSFGGGGERRAAAADRPERALPAFAALDPQPVAPAPVRRRAGATSIDVRI